MSEHRIHASGPSFTSSQYLIYALIGFIIWVIGVILVRLLGPNFFTPGSPLLLLLYGVSIPFGVVVQYMIPPMIRIPMKDALIPAFVMVGTALICDGIAIGFTNVYSADTTMKMLVGGWLLWTFGWQCLISLLIVGRAKNQA